METLAGSVVPACLAGLSWGCGVRWLWQGHRLLSLPSSFGFAGEAPQKGDIVWSSNKSKACKVVDVEEVGDVDAEAEGGKKLVYILVDLESSRHDVEEARHGLVDGTWKEKNIAEATAAMMRKRPRVKAALALATIVLLLVGINLHLQGSVRVRYFNALCFLIQAIYAKYHQKLPALTGTLFENLPEELQPAGLWGFPLAGAALTICLLFPSAERALLSVGLAVTSALVVWKLFQLLFQFKPEKFKKGDQVLVERHQRRGQVVDAPDAEGRFRVKLDDGSLSEWLDKEHLREMCSAEVTYADKGMMMEDELGSLHRKAEAAGGSSDDSGTRIKFHHGGKVVDDSKWARLEDAPENVFPLTCSITFPRATKVGMKARATSPFQLVGGQAGEVGVGQEVVVVGVKPKGGLLIEFERLPCHIEDEHGEKGTVIGDEASGGLVAEAGGLSRHIVGADDVANLDFEETIRPGARVQADTSGWELSVVVFGPDRDKDYKVEFADGVKSSYLKTDKMKEPFLAQAKSMLPVVSLVVIATMSIFCFSTLALTAELCFHLVVVGYAVGANWGDMPLQISKAGVACLALIASTVSMMTAASGWLFPSSLVPHILMLVGLSVVALVTWVRSAGEKKEQDNQGSLDSDTVGGFIIHVTFLVAIIWSLFSTGVVARAFFFTDSPALTWGVESARRASTQTRELLSLSDKMPLWMNVLVCFSKPIVLTKIFGVPKTDAAASASYFKLLMVAPFFVTLTVVSWLSDLETVLDIMADRLLEERQRVLALLFAASVSSNVQTALAFGTMFVNYMSANNGEMKEALLSMGRLQGWSWVVVMGATALIYLPILFVVVLVALPGIGFYAWLSMPFLGASWAYWSFLRREASKEDSPLANLLGTSATMTKGILGPLADGAVLCPSGHLMLPTTSEARGYHSWGCNGMTSHAYPEAAGAAWKRREAAGHVCAQPRGRVERKFAKACFTCVVCQFDLCETCYAEERTYKAQNSPSPLEQQLEEEKVVRVYEENAFKTRDEYMRAATVMKIEAAKQWALSLIPLVPVLGALVPMLVPVALRFYMGEGYLNAILSTWNDRNVDAFVNSLTDASVKQLHNGKRFMHFVGTGQFDPLLRLIIKWIQTLNYAI